MFTRGYATTGAFPREFLVYFERYNRDDFFYYLKKSTKKLDNWLELEYTNL